MLATKVWGRMHAGPGGGRLSRKAILEQVDALKLPYTPQDNYWR